MGLKRKYITVEDRYEIDDWFYYKLNAITKTRRVEVVEMVTACIDNLPENDISTQLIAGDLKGSNPIFFEVEFYRPVNGGVSLMDINTIYLDDYLDYIDENSTIKSYTNEINFKREGKYT